ncbi:hypothetical protein SKDZ_04G2140 [Saccharomyces kudriavzevii ZP591]|nr:hypothetical protein SKDZ_04G2140 [Saccharomyces kudriavzevii ZP591]
MASTELSLKRTLTDILEDELYHTSPAHNQFPGHYQNYHPNSSITPYKLVNNSKESNGFTWNHSYQQQNESSAPSIPPQQTYHFPIFNKYADPTLTTTTSFTSGEATANDRQINNVHLIPNEAKTAAETPLQKTVNLKNVMKVSDPYVPTRNIFNYDVKISNDFFDNGDNLYGNDEEVLFYEDNYNPKMQWSLQDNSAAINNEDARAIFNNEFDSDDDDISDDEEDEIEEEEGLQQQQQQQQETLLPLDDVPTSIFCTDQKMGRTKSTGHLFNEYSYVDSNIDGMTTVMSENVLDKQGHGNDEEEEENEEEDNDLDEDDIYDISLLKNRRKQSFVLNKNTIDFERFSSPSTSTSIPSNATKRKQTKSSTNRSAINSNNENSIVERIKKPTSIVSNSNTNRRKLINYTKKHLSSHSSPSNSNSKSTTTSSSSAHASYSDGTSEIFTCQIMNLITNEPCGAQFSRSYDLTRHQNTIHAKRKIVFRCSECIKILGSEGYQKTFSRLDALTRHIKSKHEDLSLEQRQEVTKFAKANIGYVMG